MLRRLAAELATHCQERDVRGRTIAIKVRLDDWTTVTRARTVGAPTNATDTITDVALELLRAYDPPRPVRLLGVRAPPSSEDAEAAAAARRSSARAAALSDSPPQPASSARGRVGPCSVIQGLSGTAALGRASSSFSTDDVIASTTAAGPSPGRECRSRSPSSRGAGAGLLDAAGDRARACPRHLDGRDGAQELALHHPDRVRTLALGAPTPAGPQESCPTPSRLRADGRRAT